MRPLEDAGSLIRYVAHPTRTPKAQELVSMVTQTTPMNASQAEWEVESAIFVYAPDLVPKIKGRAGQTSSLSWGRRRRRRRRAGQRLSSASNVHQPYTLWLSAVSANAIYDAVAAERRHATRRAWMPC